MKDSGRRAPIILHDHGRVGVIMGAACVDHGVALV
jgi:hypothetical protein